MVSPAENPSPPQAGREERAQRGTRRCSGQTRQGKPCKAPPRKDKDTCVSHATKEEKQSLRFGGAQPGAGRPKRPRAVDIYRQRVEAEADEWFTVLTDAREAQIAIPVWNGEKTEIKYAADHGTRIRAFREAHDRTYGRPMQFHDVTTREEESEVDSEIRKLLAEMDRRPQVPAPANGNGHVH